MVKYIHHNFLIYHERRRNTILLLSLIAALDPINGDFFEALFTEHANRVYQIAYGFVYDKEDAKDLVQETFIKIYKKIDKFRGLKRNEIIALIVIYTKNTSKDFLRRKKRRINPISLCYEEDGEEYEYEIPDSSDGPEEVFINQSISKQIGAHIDLLPDAQREVIILKYYYDFSAKDIGDILGITENAVNARISRAKDKLRETIGDDLRG